METPANGHDDAIPAIRERMLHDPFGAALMLVETCEWDKLRADKMLEMIRLLERTAWEKRKWR